MKQEYISVIIPTYKPTEYLKECLSALIKQTLPPDKYEIIIVLNGCNEPYYATINEFIGNEKIANTRIIQTNTPGVSNARNIGIDAARGEYLTFIDDDDWISENYLSQLLEKASKNCIVESNVIDYNDNIKKFRAGYLAKAFEHNSNDNKSFFAARSFLSTSCCKIIPKNIIEEMQYDTSLSRDEDALFMFAISKNIKHIKYTDSSAIYYRRLTKNSASRKHIKIHQKITHATYMCIKYLITYLRSPQQYNYLIFTSRIIASIIKVFKY